MALINWTPSLSVGVAEMDEQHKKLIKIINDLHDAMKDGKGNEIIASILNELVSYTKTHFAAEESYMQKFKYPELNSQKTMHAEFVKKITDIQQQHKNGQSVTLEIMKFLNQWLTGHIMGADKKYGPTFNQNGMK